MSIKDVAAQLDVVLGKIDAARALLNLAADLIDEATAIFGAAVAGMAAPDALQASAWFSEAQQGIRSPLAVLNAAEDAIRAYRTQLVGEPHRDQCYGGRHDPAGGPVAVVWGTVGRPCRGEPERVEELRRQLPPQVASGAGQKTHGRWIDPNGNVHQEVSGKDEKSEEALRFFEEEIKSRRTPVTVVDVEIKLAVYMRKNAIRSATLVINNLPCLRHEVACVSGFINMEVRWYRRCNPGFVSTKPSPLSTCVAGNGRVRSSNESRRVPVPSGSHGQGEDRTGECSEPSVTPRYVETLADGKFQWGTGLAAEKRQVPAMGQGLAGWTPPSRGSGGTLPGRFLRTRNVVTPTRSTSQCRLRGRPTVRKAEPLSGIGMIQEANASSRKETGNRARPLGASMPGRAGNWLDTGAVPDPKGS